MWCCYSRMGEKLLPPPRFSCILGIKLPFSSWSKFKGNLLRKGNKQDFMRGCFPPLCFVLCPMQGKKETYQQARAAVWLVCIHLLPNGGQGCFSKKNVLPSPTRHCGLKGVTCLHRKGALITYHTDRQRRQQREPRGAGISELLGINPIF